MENAHSIKYVNMGKLILNLVLQESPLFIPILPAGKMIFMYFVVKLIGTENVLLAMRQMIGIV